MRVITFGSFDLFHIGHLRILERARALGDSLVVGVSSDAFHKAKRNYPPVYNENDRLEIVKAIYCVDDAFLEQSFEKKRDYILQYKADILVMGSDWEGKFDEFSDICKVVYLERTPGISSTSVKMHLIRKADMFKAPEQS